MTEIEQLRQENIQMKKDIAELKEMITKKNNKRRTNPCDLCGDDRERPEFIITSKHLSSVLPELQKYNTKNLDHITKHICTKCFCLIFDKK